jgi:hypothetical protein
LGSHPPPKPPPVCNVIRYKRPTSLSSTPGNL